MLASSPLVSPRFRPRARATAVLGFACVVAVGLIRHHSALLCPTPQQDEPVFVEAAAKMAAGQSPYAQERYNYPPPLAALGAFAVERGGPGHFLALVRGANLLATSGLAIFAAGFAGLAGIRRFTLAAAMIALLPIVQYTLWIGNLTPIAAGIAILGWRIGEHRPLAGAALIGCSLVFKPIALAGAVYLSIRWMTEPQGDTRRRIEALAWLPMTFLLLSPWAAELPALARRMTEPPIFSSRNLSFRRLLSGLGLEAPASAITLVVIVAAVLLAYRRPVDVADRVHTAPVVALLALPVSWAHGFLFVLPLQVAAARRYWDRRALRQDRSWQKLAEHWGVPLGLAVIQGSANAGVEFAAPEWVHTGILLLPILAPTALLVYLRQTVPTESSPLTSGRSEG